MLELPIGTKFKWKDVDLVVEKNKTGTCNDCYFMGECPEWINCPAYSRSDKTNIIFKQIKPKLYLNEQDFELLKQIIKNVEGKLKND